MEAWKKSMAGKNEEKVVEVLEGLGFVYGIDFVSQYPIGERFVLDIAFVNEQIAIEVDGESHQSKKAQKNDRSRDNYLYCVGWCVIRVNDVHFFDAYKMSFYKNLIREVVNERRRQYDAGSLYAVDIPNYVEGDY